MNHAVEPYVNAGVPGRELSQIQHEDDKRTSHRSEVDLLLSLSIVFSFLLVILRMLYTGKESLSMLVWNLFLAAIPYCISSWVSARKGRKWWGRSSSLLTALIVACWLLFIPNSFYILTDLFHLNEHPYDRLVPQWYDLILILSFAWNGLLLGILSVRQMERYLQPLLAPRHELLFLYPVMWLNALGVYIGRYLRYNSWDIVMQPLQLFGDIARMVLHPARHQNAWGMVFFFSVFMTLLYLMIKKIGRALY